MSWLRKIFTESEEIEKRYFGIGQVAKAVGGRRFATSTIRHWEKEVERLRFWEGQGIRPKKINAKGVRYYTVKEVNLVYDFYKLIEVCGYTIAGAVNIFQKRKEIFKVYSSFDYFIVKGKNLVRTWPSQSH